MLIIKTVNVGLGSELDKQELAAECTSNISTLEQVKSVIQQWLDKELQKPDQTKDEVLGRRTDQYGTRWEKTEKVEGKDPTRMRALKTELKMADALISINKGVFEDTPIHFESAFKELQETGTLYPGIYYALSLICEANIAEDDKTRTTKLDAAIQSTRTVARSNKIFCDISQKVFSLVTKHLAMKFQEYTEKYKEYLEDYTAQLPKVNEMSRRVTGSNFEADNISSVARHLVLLSDEYVKRLG